MILQTLQDGKGFQRKKYDECDEYGEYELNQALLSGGLQSTWPSQYSTFIRISPNWDDAVPRDQGFIVGVGSNDGIDQCRPWVN